MFAHPLVLLLHPNPGPYESTEPRELPYSLLPTP